MSSRTVSTPSQATTGSLFCWDVMEDADIDGMMILKPGTRRA